MICFLPSLFTTQFPVRRKAESITQSWTLCSYWQEYNPVLGSIFVLFLETTPNSPNKLTVPALLRFTRVWLLQGESLFFVFFNKSMLAGKNDLCKLKNRFRRHPICTGSVPRTWAYPLSPFCSVSSANFCTRHIVYFTFLKVTKSGSFESF